LLVVTSRTHESVAYKGVSRPQKLVYGVSEKCGAVAVHVEFDGDSMSLLHIPHVGSVIEKRWGVGPVVVGGLLH
jgi:hypothetical protein